jgi:hypothetical protein
MEIPEPFQMTDTAWERFGLGGVHVRCLIPKESEEALCGLLLYAQARSRGKPWSMEAKYETGDIVCLQVEYDAHRAWGGERVWNHSLLHVHYVVPVSSCWGRGCDDPLLPDGPEGRGLYLLDLPRITALCLTMAEALHAINSVAPYIPTVLSIMERYALHEHLRRCLLGTSDPIRAAALQRALDAPPEY